MHHAIEYRRSEAEKKSLCVFVVKCHQIFSGLTENTLLLSNLIENEIQFFI